MYRFGNASDVHGGGYRVVIYTKWEHVVSVV